MSAVPAKDVQDQPKASAVPERPDKRRRDSDRFAEYARTRDIALRNELAAEHLGLAEFLARRFTNRGEPLDDLVQVASLALCRAVERFDPARGLQFTTFATPTIVGELKRHFRDRGWAVRVPRRLKELSVRLGSATESLMQELGRSPTITELAGFLGAGDDDVLEAIEASRSYRSSSLDRPADEDGSSLESRLGDDDLSMETAEARIQLEGLLGELSERDRLIVVLRFFRGATQGEIAARLGISQMHVSRLLARSLETLRQATPARRP